MLFNLRKNNPPQEPLSQQTVAEIFEGIELPEEALELFSDCVIYEIGNNPARNKVLWVDTIFKCNDEWPASFTRPNRPYKVFSALRTAPLYVTNPAESYESYVEKRKGTLYHNLTKEEFYEYIVQSHLTLIPRLVSEVDEKILPGRYISISERALRKIAEQAKATSMTPRM